MAEPSDAGRRSRRNGEALRAQQEDLTVIRAKRRTVNRLGFAIQLCLLRYPGQGLRPDEHPPEAMIIFVAQQLGISPAEFDRVVPPGRA